MCDIFLYNSNIHQKSNKTKCKTNIVFSRRPSVGPKMLHQQSDVWLKKTSMHLNKGLTLDQRCLNDHYYQYNTGWIYLHTPNVGPTK